VFLTNRIEMHFIMHSEKVSETVYELVIDDAQCIEKGVKGPCSCPAIILGKTAQPDNASSSNAGFTRDDETPKKKAVKKIGNKQLKNYIGKTVCIEMKTAPFMKTPSSRIFGEIRFSLRNSNTGGASATKLRLTTLSRSRPNDEDRQAALSSASDYCKGGIRA
jgi:hypothetical protein